MSLLALFSPLLLFPTAFLLWAQPKDSRSYSESLIPGKVRPALVSCQVKTMR